MEVSEAKSDYGHVKFSFLVNSKHPIEQLELFPGYRRPPRHDNPEHLYRIYEATFTEGDWSARADRVDESIHRAVNRLEESGVAFDALDQPDVLVRAYFTFSEGAETLSSPAVKRLAACHATVWIDSYG